MSVLLRLLLLLILMGKSWLLLCGGCGKSILTISAVTVVTIASIRVVSSSIIVVPISWRADGEKKTKSRISSEFNRDNFILPSSQEKLEKAQTCERRKGKLKSKLLKTTSAQQTTKNFKNNAPLASPKNIELPLADLGRATRSDLWQFEISSLHLTISISVSSTVSASVAARVSTTVASSVAASLAAPSSPSWNNNRFD